MVLCRPACSCGFSVIPNKIKKLQVSACVASAQFVAAQMPETQVPMVILHPLAKQLGTILGLEQVSRCVWVGLVVVFLPLPMIHEPRLAVIHTSPIGPPIAVLPEAIQ